MGSSLTQYPMNLSALPLAFWPVVSSFLSLKILSLSFMFRVMQSTCCRPIGFYIYCRRLSTDDCLFFRWCDLINWKRINRLCVEGTNSFPDYATPPCSSSMHSSWDRGPFWISRSISGAIHLHPVLKPQSPAAAACQSSRRMSCDITDLADCKC